MDEFLTTDDVAALLRTSASTVRWWRHAGRGPRGFKVGRRVLYARVDVDEFIDTQRELDPEYRRIDVLQIERRDEISLPMKEQARPMTQDALQARK